MRNDHSPELGLAQGFAGNTSFLFPSLQHVAPWFTVSRAGASVALERANSRSVAGRRAATNSVGDLASVSCGSSSVPFPEQYVNILSSFKLDLKEVSLPPSTQMTCPRRSSKEEGQEQLRDHDWAGLETWGSLTSKTSGVECAGACLPSSSSQATGCKGETQCQNEMSPLLANRNRQIQAVSSFERRSLQG